MKIDLFHWQIFIIVLYCHRCLNQSINNNTVVGIEDGLIQGKVGTTVGQGKNYYAFQGIPFAKPPLGELRFQPPVKNDKWNHTLLTTQDKSDCVQGLDNVTGSEDCLYINVYTPTLSHSNLPVMVWIYGGGFLGGTSNYATYGPDYFLDENVVFVSFNYRLGIFGFLSTEDLVAPGNVGLKDQVFALQWVQRNIKYFGGNPENVTVFGESAGSASVSYLLQSPLTKGLYKAAIMESGTSLCLWALDRHPKTTAFDVGKALKVNTKNSTTLVEGLKHVNYKYLQGNATAVGLLSYAKNPLAGLFYGPVIEPYHKDAFFYNKSDLWLSKGNFQRVPVILGFNGNEGSGFFDTVTGLLSLYLLTYDILPSRLAPADLTKNELKRFAAGNDIKLHYFGLLPTIVQRNETITFISDDQFNRPIRRTAFDMIPYTSVYFYKFSYQGRLGYSGTRQYTGPGHAEDLNYLFRRNDTNIPRSDTLIRSRLVKLWTNFAKYSEPTPTRDPLLQNITWLQAGIVPGNLLYLNIDTDMELQINPFNKNMKFYERIYAQYGDPPYDTY